MKQTSIEWLADQLKFTHKEAYNDLYEVIQQAKEMHKQEIIHAFVYAYLIGEDNISFEDAEQQALLYMENHYNY